MNRGTLANQPADMWRYYDAKCMYADDALVAASAQPTFDTVDGRSYQFGRYVIEDDGLVVAEIQAQLIGTSQVGGNNSGERFVFRLPLKAKRMTGPGTVCPVPIGTAMSYFSFTAPNVNVQCTPTLADPLLSLGGDEDYYCQLYAPYFLNWGTDSIANGAAASGAIDSACKFLPGNAAEITATCTNGNVGVGTPFLFLDNFGSGGTFRANTRAATTAQLDFGWKARLEPVVGSTTSAPRVGAYYPFDWSRFTSLGPFGNMFVSLQYEAA